MTAVGSALVITAPGINCEAELAEAFALAGAAPELVTLQALRRDPSRIDRFRWIGLPGGFSYGDDIAAGRVMAALVRRDLHGALAAAVARGVPVIAPCNGFQIAVQCGLLPGPDEGVPRLRRRSRCGPTDPRGSRIDGPRSSIPPRAAASGLGGFPATARRRCFLRRTARDGSPPTKAHWRRSRPEVASRCGTGPARTSTARSARWRASATPAAWSLD